MNDYIQLAILNIAVIFICGISFLSFKEKGTRNVLLTREMSLFLRGFGSLAILLHHISIDISAIGGIRGLFYNMGAPATAIFFFVSGYGVYKSLDREGINLGKWLLRHIGTILYFYFIIWLFDVIWYQIIAVDKLNLMQILVSALTLTMVGYSNWFVKVIIFLYITTVISRCIFKKKYNYSVVLCILLYMIICRFLRVGMFWYNSVWLFSVGLILAQYEDKILPLMHKFKYIITALILIVNVICILKGGSSLVTIGVISISSVLLTHLYFVSNKLVSYLGGLSFIIYLWSLVFKRYVYEYFDIPLRTLTVFSLTLLFSIVMMYIKNGITKVLNKKRQS